MRTKQILKTALTCGGLLVAVASARAANIYKADVADALNVSTSWTNGVVPGGSDVAIWDATVAANLSSSLGGNLSWGGIQILNPSGPISILADGNTLTNGASGVDLGAATQDLTLNNNVHVGASQTWNVGAGRILTVSSPFEGDASAVLTKNGAGTLLFSSTVNGTFAGATVVNGGVLQLDSANSNPNSALGTGVITNNGATIRLNAAHIIGNALVFDGNCIVDANGFGAPMDGSWSGAGTVVISNMTSGTFTIGGNGNGGGNMNNFTGTLRLTDDATATVRFNNGGGNNNVGNVNAVFDFGNSSAGFFTRNRNGNVNFGELHGGSNVNIHQGASNSGTSTYSIGGKNTDSDFAGTFTDPGTGTGAGVVAITKVGTGKLTLTGNSTNSGATTINGGTLQIGDGGTSGAVGGNIANNAALVFDRSDSFNMTNNISGGGTMTKLGAGTLTLDGANTSSGEMIISEGTVALGAAGSVTAPISIAAGASFDVTGNPSFTLNQNLSGSGSVVGALTASGGSIVPGGDGATGTLTFANGLTESGGINNEFELSTTGGSNDRIDVVGDLTLNSLNNIIVTHVGGGAIPNGTYTLITYSGNLTGNLASLAVTISGATGILTNPPNAIALIVSPAKRAATNLTWVGDSLANSWDLDVSSNWVSGAVSLSFLSGDSVRFDATGAAHPSVNLIGLLLPSSVVVDAANDYTFGGLGHIGGSAGLTKTNTGTLTVQTANNYTGPTIIGQGTLDVSTVANGAAASGLGASSSDPTNLLFFGSTLRYSGNSAATDRGATLNDGGAVFDVSLGTENLSWDGVLSGTGALTKVGPGTLTLGVENTYSGGTVISNGVLALGSNAANSSGAGGGLGPTNSAVTFYDGTLELFGYNGGTGNNYNTVRNPLIVPAGQTGTLRMFPRGPSNSGGSSGLQSSLSGGGTLNLVVNYVRDNLSGDWSTFTGLINVTSKSGTSDEMRINNNFGYANASIFLNDGVTLDRADTANTVNDIGELAGTTLARVAAGNGSGANTTWRVGFKNTDATFAGTIESDNNIVKVGTGKWTLTAQNTYTGSTTVSNGMLALGNGSLDGSIDGSLVISIAAPGVLDVSGRSDHTLNIGQAVSQTLKGDGSVAGNVSVGFSGILSPGLPVGTLTVSNAVTLAAGSTTVMELNRSASPGNARLVAQSIAFGGNLVIANVGPNLQPGDTFDLFDGTLTGAFDSISLPAYYTWNTNNLASTGTISVQAVVAPQFQLTFSGTNVVFNATNGIPNGNLLLLTTTNIALPISSWTPVDTNVFDLNGAYNFSVPFDATAQQQFYLLEAY